MSSDQQEDGSPNEVNEGGSSPSDAGIERAGSANRSRKTLVTYRSIPGVVQVVLREPINAAFLNRSSAPLLATETPADTPSQGIKAVLRRHKVVQASSTFADMSPLGLDGAAVAAAPDASDRQRFFTFHFPADADLVNILDDFDNLPDVESVTPVPLLFPPGEPTQETQVGSSALLESSLDVLNNQWYIYRCNIDKAWKLPSATKTSGKGVVIAVIDWGFRTTHQDFRDENTNSRIELTFNSITKTPEVSRGAKISHGTGVLGQVGAGVNGVGLAGVAYEASLWAIQAGDVPETTKLQSWIDAIDFVIGQDSGKRRKIILLEAETDKGGNVEMVSEINQAIRRAIAKNIVVCIPAGNGDLDAGKDLNGNDIAPSGAIIIGATNYEKDERAKFEGALASNWGTPVVVSAPGQPDKDVTCGILTDNDYTNQFGKTSGAAAKVAGVIALMLEAHPDLTPDDVREILSSGTPVASDVGKPVGAFLDAKAAVCEALKRKGVNC